MTCSFSILISFSLKIVHKCPLMHIFSKLSWCGVVFEIVWRIEYDPPKQRIRYSSSSASPSLIPLLSAWAAWLSGQSPRKIKNSELTIACEHLAHRWRASSTSQEVHVHVGQGVTEKWAIFGSGGKHAFELFAPNPATCTCKWKSTEYYSVFKELLIMRNYLHVHVQCMYM